METGRQKSGFIVERSLSFRGWQGSSIRPSTDQVNPDWTGFTFHFWDRLTL